VITASEAAPVLGCSTRTVLRLMDAGEIPEIHLGRRRLIPLQPFLRLLGADPPNGSAPGEGGAKTVVATIEQDTGRGPEYPSRQRGHQRSSGPPQVPPPDRPHGEAAGGDQSRCGAEKGPGGSGKQPRQADQLVELAADAQLWHDLDGTAWASVPIAGHREHHPIRTKGFKTWLRGRFYAKHAKAAGGQAVQDAIEVLDAKAVFDGPQHTVHVRVAEHEDAIYLDLADDSWRCVKITATGWTVTADPPVRFRRRNGMRPLPIPVRGGRLDELRAFVNVTDDDWPLVAGFLVACLRPTGPYPVLGFLGEQGRAKSTNSAAVRRLVDPNKADLRRAPRDERDLIIAATNGWIVAYENLSALQPWLSDALAALATGSGFATRALYENDEEMIFAVCRPIVLNGIPDFVTRPDLLDRSLLVYPPQIRERARREHKELWAAFEEARPRMLGALLDALACALRRLPDVRLDRLPRMADFARWAVAAEPALGLEAGAFLAAYEANRRGALDLALDADMVAQAVCVHVEQARSWSGTAGELLAVLTTPERKADRTWPGSGQAMAGRLRRCAPALRAAGLSVDYDGGARRRLWTFTAPDKSAKDQAAAGMAQLAQLADTAADQQEPAATSVPTCAPLFAGSGTTGITNGAQNQPADQKKRTLPVMPLPPVLSLVGLARTGGVPACPSATRRSSTNRTTHRD
jgi:excisionase family DNA binding protein